MNADDERDPPGGERPDGARRTAERRGAGSRAPARRAPPTERGPDRDTGAALDVPSTRSARATPSVDERREALRAMLELADGRRARATARRRERPVLAPGVAVQILSGARRDALATIVDADYISSRVLLQPDGEDERVWVGFADVAKPTDAAARESAHEPADPSSRAPAVERHSGERTGAGGPDVDGAGPVEGARRSVR